MLNEMNKQGLFDEDNFITLSYEGGGDSGFINSTFDNPNVNVPSYVEDWCYDKLESNYGGWEINEGSQGRFEFNYKGGEVILEHAFNVEMSAQETVFEVNFGKK
jgi:hypothetical protein